MLTLPGLGGHAAPRLHHEIDQGLVEVVGARRDLGVDAAMVVAAPLLDLVLQQIEQVVLRNPLFHFLGVVQHDVRHDRPGDAPGHIRILHNPHGSLLGGFFPLLPYRWRNARYTCPPSLSTSRDTICPRGSLPSNLRSESRPVTRSL